MCLHSRKITNQSKYIGFNSSRAYEIEVPCGDCAECREQRRKEWLFRTYWQVEETIAKNGFVLFDTLSYDDDHLPHVSDYFKKYHFKQYDLDSQTMKSVELPDNLNFSCFSHEDYRYFLVRLRRELDYHGLDCKNNLKYFMSCEYGHDNVYVDKHGRVRQGTARPHYHILFFVTSTKVTPLELSRLINKCWQKGRTDGIDYHPMNYVMNHVYSANKLYTDNKKVRAVCNYVAKYVNKDGDWKERVLSRLDSLFKFIYTDDFWKDSKLKNFYKKLVRDIDVFHRQSQGFGLYALEAQDDAEVKNMIDTGMVSMPGDKGMHGEHIPIPMYFQMKLFWIQYKDNFGRLRWKRSELGSKYGMMRLRKNIDLQVQRYQEWYANIPVNIQFLKTETEITDSEGKVHKYPINQDLLDPFNPFQTQILNLLGDRSWKDYVIYKLIYSGRIRTRWSLDTGNIDDIRDMVYRRFYTVDDSYEEGEGWFNYQTARDKDYFGRRFIITRDLGDKDRGFNPVYGCYDVNSECWTGKDVSTTIGYSDPFFFKMVYCYNENSNSKFKDFDKLTRLINRFNEGYSEAKQKAYDEVEGLKKRFKNIRIQYGLQ